jgi:hypothetical protein
MWMSSFVVAQGDKFDLYVSYVDNTVVSFDLANLRSLNFSYSERTMTVNYRDGRNATYDYEHMRRMYFASASGIDKIDSDDKPLYSLDGIVLTLHEGVEKAVLYRMDGSCVITISDRVVSLQGLPAGIYVLRIDNQTAKLCVR